MSSRTLEEAPFFRGVAVATQLSLCYLEIDGLDRRNKPLGMYGMVNEAMHQMISSNYGEEVWGKIRKGAGCEVERFLRMDSYPDDVTYQLVRAAAEELGILAADLLHAFGIYWVEFARAGGYADFFRACDSYPDFILQLDAMHARLELAFPDFRPPQFACQIESQERIEVVYRSHREGLAPFVSGLLVGLGEPFGMTAAVEQLDTKPPQGGGAENRFIVRLSPR